MSLTRLPFPIRAAVLSDKSLTLTNQKSLYEFISDQLERDWEYSSLFACIQLGLLHNETVNHFISLTPTIWTALIPRFAPAPLKLPSISRRVCSMFVPHSGLFSAGILGYLRGQEESNSVGMTKGGNPPPSKQSGSAWISSQSGTASGDWARALQRDRWNKKLQSLISRIGKVLHLGLCCAIFRILGFGSIFKIVQLD
jgi:hypothetical protein